MKHISVSTFRKILITLAVISFALFYATRAQGLVYDFLTSVTTVVALLLAMVGLYLTITLLGKGIRQTGFSLIFFGIFCTVLGEGIWSYFTSIGNPVAANSASFLFMATYVLNALGFAVIAWASKIRISEFVGNVVGFLLLGVILITLANASFPISVNAISLGFLAGDALRLVIITLILQMVVMYQGGLFGRYWLSIFIGNMFILLGNFAQSILAQQYYRALWPFTVIDLIYLGGYLFVAGGFYGIADSIRVAQQMISLHQKKQR